MFSQIDLAKIKNITQEFFQKLDFEFDLESLEQKDNLLLISVQTKEPQILIGERGETLAEIQQLLKLIFKRKLQISEIFYIDLDINNYKKRKIEYLKEIAKAAAEEVSLSKKEKILAPMSAYERRIVHMELAERGDVISESQGKEPHRRIVVKPRDETT